MQIATSTKREYSVPRLTVYGTLEELTKGCDKAWGSSDGFTFQGTPIACKVS
jgi:hypothetical protein